MMRLAVQYCLRIHVGHISDMPHGWLLVFCYCLPFIVAGLALFYTMRKYRRQNRYWMDGVFPIRLEFSEKHLMMAYLSAASLIVRRDKMAMIGKLGYINAHFQHYFRESYFDFRESFQEALLNPVTVKSLVDWLVKHLSESDRLIFLKFLAGLAFYDGSLNEGEYAVIKAFGVRLGIEQSQLDKLVDEYVDRQKRARESHQSNASSRTSTSSSRTRYAEVLGLSDPFTQEEVKRSYRKLVMLYHPDKFMKDSEEIRKIAHEKFLGIREAYEELSK